MIAPVPPPSLLACWGGKERAWQKPWSKGCFGWKPRSGAHPSVNAGRCEAGQREDVMMAKSFTSALFGSLLIATALTPARAADMTNERALNPQREPQNWILHHGNYQGHRFSALKEINADTVKNLRPAFTVALSGFQSGGRYAHGNLEATPLVEDGVMYVPDGWGSVYAIDVTAGKKGVIKWK